MNEFGPPAEDAATRIARVRRELALLAKRSEARIVATHRDRPCKWWPGTVKSAVSDMTFTEAGAWHFVVERLEAGEVLEEVVLRKPPGKLGYVMKVRVDPAHELIYIKLQLGAGKVIGRSFHYSQTDYDDD